MSESKVMLRAWVSYHWGSAGQRGPRQQGRAPGAHQDAVIMPCRECERIRVCGSESQGGEGGPGHPRERLSDLRQGPRDQNWL